MTTHLDMKVLIITVGTDTKDNQDNEVEERVEQCDKPPPTTRSCQPQGEPQTLTDLN